MRVTEIPKGERGKPKVCAYVRVSSNSEEQEDSFLFQSRYWERKFVNDSTVEYVGLFSDNGVSGKSMKNRKGLNKMLELAKSGGADRIYTKSVSRFARNYAEAITIIRELRDIGIPIIFEKESINTLDPKCELILSVMASLAEEESRSISTNIRWSVKKRFADGKVMLSTKHFLGYKRDENKNLVIVPEEALIIRRIYAEFLNGYSLQQIANNLMDDGVLSPSGKGVWYVSTIKSILQNEKYKGDSHLQKTYLPDFLSPRRIKNEGQAMSWYVEDSHAAIISKETFNMVQQEFVKETRYILLAKNRGKKSTAGSIRSAE